MTARARWTMLTVLGALAVAVTGAALAWACTPQAYITIVGDDPGKPGHDRPIMPGEQVALAGHQFPAGTSVTLRWGLEGAVIAGVPTDATGAWNYTFATPSDVADGSYVVAAYATDPAEASTETASSPRARLTLTLGTPPAQPTPERQQRPTSEFPSREDGRRADQNAQQPADGGSEPAPAPPAEKAVPVPAAETDAADTVEPAEPAPATTRERFRPVPPISSPGSPPLEPREASPGSSPALTAEPLATDSDALPWLALALAGLGILFVGGAAGGLVVALRRPQPPVDSVGAEPDPPRPQTDAVDAELQEMIAEAGAKGGSEGVPAAKG